MMVSFAMRIALAACSDTGVENTVAPPFAPKAMVDLGALVTEDPTERVGGKALLAAGDFDRPNTFEIIEWTRERGGGSISGSSAFYTLFNHGGPHLDAPSHMGFGAGIDSYPIEAFSGPLKVFDVRLYPKGRTVPKETFTEASISVGDVVMIYTGYTPPQTDDALPESITLTRSAAEYLAEIPVGAFATDAFSVMNLQDQTPVDSSDPSARAAPIHHSFLSRGIPV